MTREELICSPGYITAKFQMDLFDQVNNYLKENGHTQSKLAEKLGVSKGYISQILNGNYDHRLSKLVELALAVGVIPSLRFQNMDAYVMQDCISSQNTSIDDIETCRSFLHQNGYFTMGNPDLYKNPIPKQKESSQGKVA